jgi:Family of unknown function (DUF6879)
MSDALADIGAERMELADYYADFERRFWVARSFWKLERQQVFAEPGNASWEAFIRGDWDKSMGLLELDREELLAYHRRVAAAGFTARRVRVVEFPLSPYMQWELHALRIRDECGGPVHVVAATDVADTETNGVLPEIYTIGDEVMYEAVYDDHGVLTAANRFDDPAAVRRWRDLIAGLFATGEPLAAFFAREVAPLPAPSIEPSSAWDGYLERLDRPGEVVAVRLDQLQQLRIPARSGELDQHVRSGLGQAAVMQERVLLLGVEEWADIDVRPSLVAGLQPRSVSDAANYAHARSSRPKGSDKSAQPAWVVVERVALSVSQGWWRAGLSAGYVAGAG